MRPSLILSLATALALLATPEPVSAQRRGGTTAFGLQGGATLTGFTDAVQGTDMRWGGTVGVFGSFRPSYYVETNLEVNWVQKGVDRIGIDYIDVPLTVGGVGPLAGGASVRAYAGIGIGFKVGCRSEITAVCDNAKSTEWTLPFGVMFGKTTTSGKSFGIDVRYALGLGDAFENSDVNNRAWLFRVFIATGAGGSR